MCRRIPLPLTAHNLPDYLFTHGWARSSDEIAVREMGGGVSNTVLLAEWNKPPGRRWVVKQSLDRLRVNDDWRAERERVFREADAISTLQPMLGAESLPEIIAVDRENYACIMTAAPAGAEPWKALLMQGSIDASVGRKAGELLARMMNAGRLAPELRERFADQAVFDQLRVDPYYRTTAIRHPELRATYDALIEDSRDIRTSLVHGDYSPKNMLIRNRSIFLIDFEVIHWGDPAFDAGFLLNHLFLKALHLPACKNQLFVAAREFWQALLEGPARDFASEFERMTMRHLGALMLARIDGKSPVEYIQSEQEKNQVRGVARRILLEPAYTLEEAIAIFKHVSHPPNPRSPDS